LCLAVKRDYINQFKMSPNPANSLQNQGGRDNGLSPAKYHISKQRHFRENEATEQLLWFTS